MTLKEAIHLLFHILPMLETGPSVPKADFLFRVLQKVKASFSHQISVACNFKTEAYTFFLAVNWR